MMRRSRALLPFRAAGSVTPRWTPCTPSLDALLSREPQTEAASGAQSNVGWTPAQLNSVNMHIFRYADMLLLLAEAFSLATRRLALASARVQTQIEGKAITSVHFVPRRLLNIVVR